ncbi:lymphatic vessel endothelial hyaluronic acid receptor 1 [Salmo salar]|uniref:Lymphatic vessel endothelial hyaluronic acid receptor 1 n=1 Tax=Salmo salar TaxID=8030 RepID=A0A1S3KV59_SALSA|nr:lymphatic vessel endothelial hyaluronic acid receptor 1 [Salmo salar]|eukprot:XP_013982184.1 PREDICTED: lymphatic vessel endothelial hyaluronic acid receptor 1-like [Salmo salar]
MMQVWILSLLLTLSFCGLHVDPSKINAFPERQIAGVFLVSYTNDLNQLTYAFNASEAREVCWSLGATMASNSHVEEAQRMGLETCRFGWIDEHFAVIPRIEASKTCGKNQTGVIKWRASVTKLFDVFCFNASVIQLEDTTADTALTTPKQQEGAHPSPSGAASSPSNSLSPAIIHLVPSTQSARPTSHSHSSLLSLSSFSDSPEELEVELPQSMSSAILITSTIVLLLIAMAILLYFRTNNGLKTILPCWDGEQQKEYIETEDCAAHTCLKDTKEAQTEGEAKAEPEEDVCKETANDISVNISDETNADSASETEP